MIEHQPTGDWPLHEETRLNERPVIPGYEIVEELGRGGMGVVYRARQESLKRWVALKLIRDGALAGPQERARFRIEAEAAARMRHPNIVQVYEVGEHRGQLYFVMELVEGGGLDKYLAGRPQPAQQAAQLVHTLALAVQHAHARQIVHRDLKPANILLMRNAECGMRNEDPGDSSFRIQHSPFRTPKITDFSLAKRLDSESAALTRPGAILGTASYMAPEQATGRVSDIGPAIDVYALGAILYECLTGRPPFLAESWNETIKQVLYDEPAPPTRLNPNLPRELQTICLKCLEKDPGRRYASAGQLADDLNRYLEGKPVVAVPLNQSERLARLAGRDGYQIIGEIGRGPRSTVYVAHHGPLKQPVALKIFPANFCTREEWEARLESGAHLWATLAHPQIVPVHQGGWWDDTPYLAVEHVPQGCLATRLTGQPYQLPQALGLVEQLAEIVGYLHRQGVVHGNLKPTNVLMAANGIPRLVDFHLTSGLFRRLPAGEAELAGLGYLAPELVHDSDAELRPYTDIYGLGIILYELLTGRPPFVGPTAQVVLERVRSQDPVPPSQLNAEVTPHLEGFCLRCLRKNPWRRYHRVYDVLKRLRYFQDNPEPKVVREDMASP
jgi:serine/threonine protein kinase